MKNVVNVAGGYWTGSSAVIDLLSEHSKFNVVSGEFMLFSYGQIFPDYFAPKISGDPIDDFGDSCLNRFRYFNTKDLGVYYSAARHVCRKVLNFYPHFLFCDRVSADLFANADYKRSCSVFLDEFLTVTKDNRNPKFDRISELLQNIYLQIHLVRKQLPDGDPKETLVLDQLVAPTYAQDYLAFDNSTKHIFVDRDWRDQFYYLYGNLLNMNVRNAQINLRPFGESKSEPSDLLEVFVGIRKRFELVRSQLENNPIVKFIDFETLVEQRDELAVSVFDFLETDKSGWAKGSYFKPEVSSKNIGIWRNLTESNSDFAQKIEYLETQLSC